MNVREVLNAVNKAANVSVRSARELVSVLGDALKWPPSIGEPVTLRLLLHRALGWRMQFVIRHVFVLMMENRSFDHIFGYSGITGRDARNDQSTAVDCLVRVDGTLVVHTNVNPRTGASIPTRRFAPFSLPGHTGDLGHEFLDVMEQLCGRPGLCTLQNLDCHDDGPFQYDHGMLPGEPGVYPQPAPPDETGFVANFVRTQPNLPPETPMQGFDPHSLPVLNTLAEEFAICDHWFASHPGPTWPNRFFVHAASATGQVDSPPTERIVEAVTANPFTFHNGTIYDRLSDRGLQHRVYAATLNCAQIRGIQANHVDIQRFPLQNLQQDLQSGSFGIHYVFIEPDPGPQPPADCDSIQQNDMHPPSDVRDGERLIRLVYETIRNSPVWNQSLLVIIFDEHGGFFDHVTPPQNDSLFQLGDGSVDNTHRFQFNQLGVRIPAVIVSPWIPRNVIDHMTYDHTSLLSSVEKLYGLASLTRRDAAANQFLDLFSQITAREDTVTLPAPPHS